MHKNLSENDEKIVKTRFIGYAEECIQLPSDIDFIVA